MNEFIKTLLSLSLSGTLLFLLVFLPKRLYRERFSRRWQYYIWLVVALRFLLPFAPGITFTGYLFDRMEMPAAPAAGNQGTVYGTADDMQVHDSEASYNAQNQESNQAGASDYNPVAGFGSPNVQDTNISGTPGSSSLQYLHTGIFCLWLITAIALLVRKATAYHSFLRFLKTASIPVSDVETLNLLSDCTERLRIRGTVELYANPLIASPILAGFFRPKILLPVREDSGRQKDLPGKEALSCIFTHELIHYKRLDMLYKWFIQFILCVHWFNPFVHLLARETGRACELACDESVTAMLDDTGKKSYGNTLLAFLRTDNAYKSPLVSITLTEGAKELKERLGAIMKNHKKTKTTTLFTALATATICIAFCTLGAYAKSGPDAQPEQDSSQSSLPPDNTPSLGSDIHYEYDNGVYYIYKDGTSRSDRPLVGFTDGCLGITLIGRESYTSLGPFDQTMDGDEFLEQIAQICTDMVAGKSLTPEDARIILMSAEEIKDSFSPASRPSGSSGSASESSQITLEDVDIRFYRNGSPYLHNTFVSHAGQTITELETGILAYDAEGRPLKLHWNFLDSSAEAGYENLIRQTGLPLRPGASTDDYPGGWSLKKEDADRISYVISCLKEVVFEDGTVWSNPSYDDWRESYLGKEVSTEELQRYYPQEYAVTD